MLRIEHIAVTKGALDLRVSVPLALLRVSPEMAAAALATYPNLARHVCVNEHGETFGDDIEGTWTAHLLEHLIIELQAQAEVAAGKANPGAGLIGHTSWLEELEDTKSQGYALMRVKVTCHDDLVALQACKDAAAFINGASDKRR